MQTPQFGGFQPSGKVKIAQAMGFQGPMEQFDRFLEDNPDKQAEMMRYENIARKMVSGGYVAKMQEGGMPKSDVVPPDYDAPVYGGPVPTPEFTPDILDKLANPPADPPSITDMSIDRIVDPKLPAGAVTTAYGVPTDPNQTIAEGTGAVGDMEGAETTTVDTTAQAETPEADKANTYDPAKSAEQVGNALDSVQAAQTDPDDARSKVVAAEQTKSAVSDLDAAKGTAHLIENPVQRKIEEGELISGSADAEKAKQFTEEIQAAEATPSQEATTAGQLKKLTEGFDASNPPPWASSAMQAVGSEMARRGLSISSDAGQALLDAALRSALPIAQADASTFASFEAQNLSNRQARAMLAAEQRAKFMEMEFTQDFQSRVQNSARIGDIANMNFTAEQNIALENSRAVNTMNLANLNNEQAMVMAEASALSNLDMANLNNRQQAAVQNAQNFMQLDMANLSNEQQTTLFKAQQQTTALFNDQAATNAAKQFNATSENQTEQFFANLAQQNSQYNASQTNAINQFNAGQENAMAQFNSEMDNQRDQFDAKNALVIAQNNAQWRREIATADTAAINRANELNANAVLGVSNQAYANLWNYYSDTMEWAWTSAENSLERSTNMAMAELDAKTRKEIADENAKSAAGTAIGELIGTIGSAWITGGPKT